MSTASPADGSPRHDPTRPRPPDHLPPTASLDGLEQRSSAEAAFEPASLAAYRVGWGFITLHALAYFGTWLALASPVIVTLALKENRLVGTERIRPRSDCLAVVSTVSVTATAASTGPPRLPAETAHRSRVCWR